MICQSMTMRQVFENTIGDKSFMVIRKDESILRLIYPCMVLSQISESAKGYSDIPKLGWDFDEVFVNHYVGIESVSMS